MRDIVLEGLLANGTEKMIRTGLWFLNDGWVFLCLSFFAIQIFKVFLVFFLKMCHILLSILSLISERKKWSSRWSSLIEIWKIIFRDRNLSFKELLEVLDGLRIIDEIVMVLLCINLIIGLHSTGGLMCSEHSMIFAWNAENCLLCFFVKGFSLCRIELSKLLQSYSSSMACKSWSIGLEL